MSADNTSNPADLQPKPMKGKYDGRKNNGRYKSKVKRGPKPLYLQHISRNRAALIVKEFDSIASWPEILAAGWEKRDIAACTQVRIYVENRLYGRPFVAENPAQAKTGDTLAEDSRLQDALAKLKVQLPAKSVM
jgi:hypothetical protein